MTRSKDGWTRLRFGDVAEQVNERVDDPTEAGVDRYVGLEHLDPDSLRITRWGSPGDVAAQKLRFRSGDIIFGKRRAYQRKVAVADFDGICSAHAMVLRERPETIAPGFLAHFMLSDVFMNRAVRISVGSLSPTINWSTLREQEFDLPGVEDQAHYAFAMACVSQEEDAARHLVASATTLLDSARDTLCAFSEGDARARLDSVCSMQNGKAFSGSEYCEQGIRLLRPGNLAADGYMTWEAERTTCLPDRWRSVAETFVVRDADIVINLTAQSLEDGFMGRVCMATEHDESLLNQRIGRFEINHSQVLPAFLFRCLQSTRFRNHAIANCEGSKVKHLFWSHLAKFEIPLPTIPRQTVIVTQLARVEESRQRAISRLAHATSLRKALLRKLG